MNNKNVKVTMTLETLEDLVYHACYRASRKVEQELFKGLIPFLNLNHDLQEDALREIEYIKTLLQSRNMSEFEEE